MKLNLLFLKNISKIILKQKTKVVTKKLTFLNLKHFNFKFNKNTKTLKTKLKTFLNFKFKIKRFFFFYNLFFITFLENFLKLNILLNIKKNANKIPIKQISKNLFFNKFFKKNLKITRQIISIIYYSILLKDTLLFINFFKKKIEKLSIKLHKKVLLGLKKLIKYIFVPLFKYLGLLGIFLNIRGKLGVSGNAKKRRYFFYFGKHSLTKRTLKFNSSFVYIWTFTGVLGLNFLLFF